MSVAQDPTETRSSRAVQTHSCCAVVLWQKAYTTPLTVNLVDMSEQARKRKEDDPKLLSKTCKIDRTTDVKFFDSTPTHQHDPDSTSRATQGTKQFEAAMAQPFSVPAIPVPAIPVPAIPVPAIPVPMTMIAMPGGPVPIPIMMSCDGTPMPLSQLNAAQTDKTTGLATKLAEPDAIPAKKARKVPKKRHTAAKDKENQPPKKKSKQTLYSGKNILRTDQQMPSNERLADAETTPEEEDEEEEVQYEVERILMHRGSGRNLKLLIKWQGYDVSENSWECERDVSPAVVAEYMASMHVVAACMGKRAKPVAPVAEVVVQALAKGTVQRTDDGKSVQLRIRPLEEDAGNGVFINNGEEVDIFAYGEFMHVKYGRAKGYIKSQYVTVGCWSGIDGNGA